MHFFPAVLTFAAFWAILPVKLVAIAGFVYVIVAAIKAKYPTLPGKYALILNIIFSACGVVGFAKPAEFSDPHFWAGLILAIASAAGIHGTVKAATKPDDDGGKTPQQISQSANVDRSDPRPSIMQSFIQVRPPAVVLLFLAASLFVLPMTGCVHTGVTSIGTALPTGAVDSNDANAYKTLRPAHDFAASMSSDIQTGKLTASPSLKLAMESLNRALNVADQAEQSYHNAGGGNAAAMNSAVAAVLEAWGSAQAAFNVQGN